MIRNILFILLSSLLVGCENDQHDLVIQKAAKNCECSKEIERAQMAKVREIADRKREFGFRGYGPTYGDVNCNGPFYLNDENTRNFSKTRTLEIFNKSETKVYEVMVQIKNSGKVHYETYYIEPTQSVVLGCNFDFDAHLDKLDLFAESIDRSKMELVNFKPIEYNLHRVSLFSEY